MATIAMARRVEAPDETTWMARCLAAVVVVASFWFVSHSLGESQRIAEETALGPDRAENRTAARQAETTTTSAVGYLLLGGAGAALIVTAPRRRLRWNYALILLAAVYVAWCALSILWSIDSLQTFRKLTIQGLMLMAAVGAAMRFDLKDLGWILVISLAALVGVGVLSEAAYGTLRPWRADFRFCGTVHPNDQGMQCALLALAAATLETRRTQQRWLLRGLVALALAGLWFTKSRTTLASFVVTAAVGLVMRSRGVQRWLVLSACLTLVCVGGIAASFVSVAAVDETADVAAMGRRKDVNSLTGRLPLWEELWRAAEKRPWLGYGFGGFWNGENTLKYSEMLAWHIPHGHNSYLDIGLSVGIIGLGLYLLWLLSTIGACVWRYDRTGDRGRLFALCLLAFAVIHGLTESKFPGLGIGGLAMLTAMMMIAVQREPIARQRSAGRRRPWRTLDGPTLGRLRPQLAPVRT